MTRKKRLVSTLRWNEFNSLTDCYWSNRMCFYKELIVGQPIVLIGRIRYQLSGLLCHSPPQANWSQLCYNIYTAHIHQSEFNRRDITLVFIFVWAIFLDACCCLLLFFSSLLFIYIVVVASLLVVIAIAIDKCVLFFCSSSAVSLLTSSFFLLLVLTLEFGSCQGNIAPLNCTNSSLWIFQHSINDYD